MNCVPFHSFWLARKKSQTMKNITVHGITYTSLSACVGIKNDTTPFLFHDLFTTRRIKMDVTCFHFLLLDVLVKKANFRSMFLGYHLHCSDLFSRKSLVVQTCKRILCRTREVGSLCCSASHFQSFYSRLSDTLTNQALKYHLRNVSSSVDWSVMISCICTSSRMRCSLICGHKHKHKMRTSL